MAVMSNVVGETKRDEPTEKSMIKVINRHHKLYPNEPSHYIGRGTPLGNPFPITEFEDRELVIARYRVYMDQQIKEKNPSIINALNEITNQAMSGQIVTLICSCKPKACHGDVIKELIEEKIKQHNEFVPKKIIVAGGRDFNDYAQMDMFIYSLMKKGVVSLEDELVCGMARGADLLGKLLWERHFKGAVYNMPADWDTYGKSAGYRRNAEMGELADMAIIFWDGKSRGTKHMIDIMARLSKPVYIEGY